MYRIGVAAAVAALATTVALADRSARSATTPTIAAAQLTDGRSNLVLVGLDGQTSALIAGGETAAWSHDGHRLAYAKTNPAAERTSSWIEVANSDGSQSTQLTSGQVSDSSPSWSPDGTQIVFARWSITANSVLVVTSVLYVMRADGSDLHAITAATGNASSPSWSPDGSEIAYTETSLEPNSAQIADSGIYLVHPGGSDARRLSPAAALDDSPAWSPDGQRIAFVSGSDHYSDHCGEDDCFWSGELYVMDADGSGRTRLTKTATDEERPTFSPDGSKLAFSSDPPGTAFSPIRRLYLINADGSCERPLTAGAGWVVDPAWKPDSTDSGPLHCNPPAPPPPVHVRFTSIPPTHVKVAISGATASERTLLVHLLAQLGPLTLRRIRVEPASTHGSIQLVFSADARAKPRVASMRAVWEASQIADVFAYTPTTVDPHRRLASYSLHYLLTPQATAFTSSYEPPHTGSPPGRGYQPSAAEIARNFHAQLPRGLTLRSLTFAREGDLITPIVVVAEHGSHVSSPDLVLTRLFSVTPVTNGGEYLEIIDRCDHPFYAFAGMPYGLGSTWARVRGLARCPQ